MGDYGDHAVLERSRGESPPAPVATEAPPAGPLRLLERSRLQSRAYRQEARSAHLVRSTFAMVLAGGRGSRRMELAARPQQEEIAGSKAPDVEEVVGHFRK